MGSLWRWNWVKRRVIVLFKATGIFIVWLHVDVSSKGVATALSLHFRCHYGVVSNVKLCLLYSMYLLPGYTGGKCFHENWPINNPLTGLRMGSNNLCSVTRHFLFFPDFPMSLFIRPWRHFLRFLQKTTSDFYNFYTGRAALRFLPMWRPIGGWPKQPIRQHESNVFIQHCHLVISRIHLERTLNYTVWHTGQADRLRVLLSELGKEAV